MAEISSELKPIPRELPPFYVGIIMMGRSGDLLLQQRDNKPWIVNPGKIGTFGGGGNEGESTVNACIREVKEETNIDLRPDELFFLLEYQSYFQGEIARTVTMFGAANVRDDNMIITEGQLVRLKPDDFPLENMTGGTLRSVPVFLEHYARMTADAVSG